MFPISFSFNFSFYFLDIDDCAVDKQHCNGDADATCVDAGPNSRLCSCPPGTEGTQVLADTDMFGGCKRAYFFFRREDEESEKGETK